MNAVKTPFWLVIVRCRKCMWPQVSDDSYKLLHSSKLFVLDKKKMKSLSAARLLLRFPDK